MAQLKGSVVQGSLRVTDTVYTTTAQLSVLKVPTASTGTNIGAGTAGHILFSNGTTASYWGSTTGITALGNITTGTWNATTINPNRGGTGVNSYAKGDILYAGAAIASSATTALSKLALGTAGYTLQATANGPAWQQTVNVANGGTGKTSWTQWGILYASASTTLTNTAAGTNGALLSGKGSAAPAWKASANGAVYATSTNGDLQWGTLPVGQGGTGATTAPTKGGVIFGSSTTAYGCTAAGTSGQLLQSAGTGTPTWITATNTNTASTIVKRDASGNFSAGTITADLVGTADYAHSLWQRYDIAKGTKPTGSTLWLSNWFNYQTGTTSNVADRIGGGIYSWIATNGDSGLGLAAYKHVASSTDTARIEIISQPSSIPYISVYGQLVIQPENSAHEGGQIQLVKGPSDSQQCYLDTCSNEFRIHNGSTVQTQVNLSNGNITCGNLYLKFQKNIHMQPTSGSSYYGVLTSFENGNIGFHAAGGSVYLGYYNTNSVYVQKNTNPANNSLGHGLMFWDDTEGGNLRIYSGNCGTYGSYYWEMDAYNGNLRFYNVNSAGTYKGEVSMTKDNVMVTRAMWNDYAECRQTEILEAGRVVTESTDGIMKKTSKRLLPGCKVISDTYGHLIGQSKKNNTPIAVSGRVLAYPYQDRNKYELGAAVCSAPNGTIDIMTREEIMQYPERIIGTVSEIPDYEDWYSSDIIDKESVPIKINGRIWIYVK